MVIPLPILSGFLFVDKPINLTSSNVVTIIKKQLKPYKTKVGHGGTLDPLATGVLPIAIGEATKLIDYVIKSFKTYTFTIQFGLHTNTYDLEGTILEQNNYMPNKIALLNCLANFVGEQLQQPPSFSAIKINGKRSYSLARQNIITTLPKRNINILSINMLNYNANTKTASFTAEVSSGTYIRSLAVDIAKSVNSLGCVTNLRRTNISNLQHLIKEKVLIDNNLLYNIPSCLNKVLVNIENMLDDILAININLEQKQFLLQGNINFLNNNNIPAVGMYKAMYNNKLVALLHFNSKWQIIRVLNDYINFI